MLHDNIIIITKTIYLIHLCTKLEYKFGTTAYGYKQYWNLILPFSHYVKNHAHIQYIKIMSV
jgi:hypothetical protein